MRLPPRYVELAPARKNLYSLFERFIHETESMSCIIVPCVYLYPGHEPQFPQAWVPGSRTAWVEYLEIHRPRGVFEFIELMNPFSAVFFKPASEDSLNRIMTHTKRLRFEMKNGVARVDYPARVLRRFRKQQPAREQQPR